jgi:uncharacterized membrane protein
MRHREVTRLEGFSDAVFGFALTLLVVQLETPDTPQELDQLVRGSIPFALMFAMVGYIWWEHNKFFRRTGLQDAPTAFLNSVLLFVVLFYVYPFKYLTVAVLGPLFGLPRVPFGDASRLMLLYSGAVFLIFGTLALLYAYAWRRRHTLGLDAMGLLELQFGWRSQMVSTAIAAASILLAAILPERYVGFAGMIFILMGPLHAWNGYAAGAAFAAERARAGTAAANPA